MADPERQEELARFGFTVVDLFDAGTLAALRALSADVGPAPDDPQVALNWSFHSRSDDYKTSLKRLLPLAAPALDATFTDHVVYLTTFITKWPGPNGAFPPHQDPTLVDERHHTGVTIWAPLDDVGPENGMLYVVPGSHRFSSALRIQDVDHSTFGGLEQVVVDEHGRGVPLRAGEAMVFDNRILHYSLPNVTDEARVVLSFGLRPRSASCVVVLAAPDGVAEVHAVPDDFYIDVLPATRDGWRPEVPPLARVAQAPETWFEDDFSMLCAQVGPAPRAEVLTPPAEALAGALDTGVFCALCGSSEGLSEADRAGRDNAQLRCPACVADLAAAGTEGAPP